MTGEPAGQPPNPATGLEQAIVTRAEDYGSRSRRIFYRLPDGRETAVTIAMADDTPELRAELGRALTENRRRYNPRRSNNQP